MSNLQFLSSLLRQRQYTITITVMHAVNKLHVINWDIDKVVQSHPYYHQRHSHCCLKVWHIRSEAHTIWDGDPLPSIYNPSHLPASSHPLTVLSFYHAD